MTIYKFDKRSKLGRKDMSLNELLIKANTDYITNTTVVVFDAMIIDQMRKVKIKVINPKKIIIQWVQKIMKHV